MKAVAGCLVLTMFVAGCSSLADSGSTANTAPAANTATSAVTPGKSDSLAKLAADPEQKVPPQWVRAVPPYPLTLFSKVEVDLASVRPGVRGGITVWNRETYMEERYVSAEESFSIGEARYWFDCKRAQFNIEYVHTRKADGKLVRSRSIADATRLSEQAIPPKSLISAEAALACGRAANPS